MVLGILISCFRIPLARRGERTVPNVPLFACPQTPRNPIKGGFSGSSEAIVRDAPASAARIFHVRSFFFCSNDVHFGKLSKWIVDKQIGNIRKKGIMHGQITSS